MIGIYDFYAALVESTDDAIVAKDVNGTVISWNPAAERLFGWTSDEMVGGSIRRLLPADRHHEEDDILARIARGERVGQFLTKRLHKNGELLDISVTVSPVRDAMGTVVGASKIARNAGPYLKQQAELLQSKGRFETMANNIAPLCWMANPDGHLFWYNQRWYDYTGTTFEQMDGWGWEMVQHPDHLERVKTGWLAKLASGEEWEDTFPLRGRDGEWRWYLSRAKPIRDENGEIIRWFGTNTDITEQRDQAEQIRLLLMEVNHRSKNMLSTIQALLRRSIDGQEEFVARFSERIRSMAVNQDILVRREWRE
ncbi:MAG: PAS domain S-box protein, partial [Pseudomonadota bacterium]